MTWQPPGQKSQTYGTWQSGNRYHADARLPASSVPQPSSPSPLRQTRRAMLLSSLPSSLPQPSSPSPFRQTRRALGKTSVTRHQPLRASLIIPGAIRERDLEPQVLLYSLLEAWRQTKISHLPPYFSPVLGTLLVPKGIVRRRCSPRSNPIRTRRRSFSSALTPWTRIRRKHGRLWHNFLPSVYYIFFACA